MYFQEHVHVSGLGEGDVPRGSRPGRPLAPTTIPWMSMLEAVFQLCSSLVSLTLNVMHDIWSGRQLASAFGDGEIQRAANCQCN